ncbi:MAG: hypothetical protein GC190_05215 [Alphaproteobacteria bacterium]|nr:hypothetical protein [Alphaproteobacteria bacterium]
MAHALSSSVIATLLIATLAGSSPTSAGDAMRFGDCARTVEPPACLLDIGEPLDDFAPARILSDVVVAGALSLLQSKREMLLAAAQGHLADGGHLMDRESFERYNAVRAEMKAAPPEVMLAAIAVASVAQFSDDPFEDVRVQSLVAPVRHSPEVAQIAAALWSDMQIHGRWHYALVRPRGLKSIWHAVAAVPPQDTRVLEELAMFADYWGARQETLVLERALLARTDLSPDNRARVQDDIARSEHKPKPITDRDLDAEFERILAGCQTALRGNGYQSEYQCQIPLEFLERKEVGGIDKARIRALLARQRVGLRAVAAAYLQHARTSNDLAEYRAIWFAVASEAYRLADDKDAAIGAAREGVPFVEPGILSHFHGVPAPSMRDPEERRRTVATFGAPATAPVVALYRAGARDEALRTGFLSGFDRFQNADVAGEERDIQWIVDDHAPSVVDRAIDVLLDNPDTKLSDRFFAGLRCAGPTFYEPRELHHLHANLATLAAISGRRTSMLQQLTSALFAGDAAAASGPNSFKAQVARDVAEHWRRSLIIADRRAARGDVPLPACEH